MNLMQFQMSDQMRSALANSNLTYVEEILLLTPEVLSKKLGIDLRYCQAFIQESRIAILPRPLEKSDLETLVTGLQELDKLGGIAKGQLFEVFGEAGSGKTNFALSCAINVALPREYGGNDGHVIYISTDHAFPINRLMTLIECLQEKYPYLASETILERIFVQEFAVRDLVDLERIILHFTPAFLDMNRNIKLIVIDSIAYNFRSEQDSAAVRATKLVEIGHVLKRCAAMHNLGILLINQVVDHFEQDIYCTTSVSHGPSQWIRISLDNFDLTKRPALGLAWSNCVNTRCTLYT